MLHNNLVFDPKIITVFKSSAKCWQDADRKNINYVLKFKKSNPHSLNVS